MDNMHNSKMSKEVKKKMSGWLIALIVVAVIFIAGALSFNTISKACQAKDTVQSAEENKK